MCFRQWTAELKGPRWKRVAVNLPYPGGTENSNESTKALVDAVQTNLWARWPLRLRRLPAGSPAALTCMGLQGRHRTTLNILSPMATGTGTTQFNCSVGHLKVTFPGLAARSVFEAGEGRRGIDLRVTFQSRAI